MKTVAVASIKGGVGKTSAAVNLAHACASEGGRALVWDLDPQGAATWSLGVGRRVPGGGRTLVRRGADVEAAVCTTSIPGLDVLPADFSLRHLDLELADAGHPKRRLRKLIGSFDGAYDTVFIDCPPGITLAIETALHASDTVVVPVVPASLPMRTLGQLRSFVVAEKQLRRLRVLPFLSMIDRRRRTHRQLVDALATDRSGLLRTPVPLSVDVEAMGARRQPVGVYAPRSTAAAAYRALWLEVEQRMT